MSRSLQPPFALRRRPRRAGDRSFAVAPSRAAEDAVIIPAPALDVQASDGIQTAVIAGGCFWGVQGVFQHTAGVVNAVSGYAGGSKATADYTMVSTGATGHAEIGRDQIRPEEDQLRQDPADLLLGRARPDPVEPPGPGHRHAISLGDLHHQSDEQKKVAEAYIAQLNAAKVYKKPIVTKVGPLEAFYPAEAYHQDYLTLHPTQPYIAYNDIPKVENLKKIFADNYIEKPTLVSQRQGHQLTTASQENECPTPKRRLARSRRARPSGARN